MLDSKDYYFHSLLLGEKDALRVFDNILKTREIRSIKNGGFILNDLRMNKSEEICLSKRGKVRLFYDSAYDLFARKKLSFIIRGDLADVYSPKLVPARETLGDTTKYDDSGLTDLSDEYRVKGKISLDDVVGINYPIGFILDSITGYKWFFLGQNESFRGNRDDNFKKRLANTINFYQELVKCLDSAGVILPIYDVESKIEIKSEKDIVKFKKKR